MENPRIKHVYMPIYLTSNLISLGFPRTPGSATIADQSGSIRLVLDRLDGTRTWCDLDEELIGQVSPSDIRRIGQALSAAGYLEDAAVDPPAGLSATALTRYSRNLEFFSYFSSAADRNAPSDRFAPQVNLASRHVTVLGVGGFGSHVAMHLAALGVGRLRLVDDDVVDESNLNRQVLFTSGDIGRPKVEVAARRLAALNPLINVVTSQSGVHGPADAQDLMKETDLVICAADRPRVDLDLWLSRAALELNRPWMRGASVGLTVALDLFIPFRTDCVECRLQTDDADGAAAVSSVLRGLEKENYLVSPCIAPVAGMLGAIAAWEALKYLTGLTTTPLIDNQLVVELPETSTHYLPTTPRADCPACSIPERQAS